MGSSGETSPAVLPPRTLDIIVLRSVDLVTRLLMSEAD